MRIAQWNANGLQTHKDEVKLFLNENQIDVLLISETHFTSKNHFTIPGYDLCCTNHPYGTAHGGTAILIKATEPYRLGFAQGRLQAKACSRELSSPTFGYLAPIGCREWAKGLRGVCCVSFADVLCGPRTFSRDPTLVEGRLTGEDRSAWPGGLLHAARRFGMTPDFVIRSWFFIFPNWSFGWGAGHARRHAGGRGCSVMASCHIFPCRFMTWIK